MTDTQTISSTYNSLELKGSETMTNGDPITNFTEGLTTYNYNNLNQLLDRTNPNKTFAYDNDGNMTQGYTPDGYAMTLTYDAENRLTTSEYTDGSSVVHKTEYTYSGDNLLAQIKKYVDTSLISDIRIVRAGFLPIQERDSGNNVIKEYTWGQDLGGGIGGLLNLKQGSNDYSYLYDGKGNVMAVIDSSQNIVSAYRYDTFGKLMTKTGTLDQPFQFSTKRYDEGMGLSYYGYRYYSPSIGRWITRDPIEEAGGMNLYGFVANNPVNFTDPFGFLGTRPEPGITSCYPSEKNCGHYPKEKLARKVCMEAGDNCWSNCVRACLKLRYQEKGFSVEWYTKDHGACFSSCAKSCSGH